MMRSHHAGGVSPWDAGPLSSLFISVLLLLHHLYPATPCPLLVRLKQISSSFEHEWQNTAERKANYM